MQLAVSGYFEVTIWDVNTARLVRRHGGLPERITSVVWHPKTSCWRSPEDARSGARWRSSTPPQDFSHASGLPEMAFAQPSAGRQPPRSRRCDRTIRFFDTGQRETVSAWCGRTRIGCNSVAFSHSERFQQPRPHRAPHEVSTGGSRRPTRATKQRPGGDSLSRDGKTAFSLRKQPGDVGKSSGATNRNHSRHRDARKRLASIHSGLAIGSPDGLVRIAPPGQRSADALHLYGHNDASRSIAVSRTPDVFATGSYDGSVCI